MTASRSRLRLLALLAAPVAAGAFLRLWQVSGQVLGGDELHAVRAAVVLAPTEVLRQYGLRDYSLPLTALTSWLLRLGVPVGEMALRAPSLLAGAAALVLLPVAVARRVGTATAVVLAWLLALSPLLVLYSRVARSYLPMTLAGFCAVAAFARWWETGERRWAALYVALGAVGLWLHLGAGPLLASPLVFAAADALRSGEGRWPRLRAAVLVGLALGGGWLLLLLPARESLVRLASVKHRALRVSPAAAWEALRLHAGSADHLVAALFWIAAAAGLLLLLARHRRFAVLTVTVVVGQAAGLALLSPQGAGHPLILARYLLVALPFALLWVAYALAEPWRRPRTAAAIAGRCAGAAAVAALFLAGPVPAFVRREGSFDHHNATMRFTAPPAAVAPGLMPPVYARLPPGPLLELPWPTSWEHSRTLPAYQERHGRPVLVSAAVGFPRHPALAFRNEVPPEPAAILASRARTLVVHLRSGPEEARFVAATGLVQRELPPEDRQLLRRHSERLVARLVAAWGPPQHRDEWTASWDLAAVRARLRDRSLGPAPR